MKTLRIQFCLFLLCTVLQTFASADEIDFESQIRPLLNAKCFDCHGAETQESHLRLDGRSSILRGGDSGEPAIVIGDGEASHLIKLVRGEEAGKLMPPDEADRLSK